jgi:hypothetical protein
MDKVCGIRRLDRRTWWKAVDRTLSKTLSQVLQCGGGECFGKAGEILL